MVEDYGFKDIDVMTIKHEMGKEGKGMEIGISLLWDVFVTSIFSLRHGLLLATIYPLS